MDETVTIRSGEFAAMIAPAIGGSLAGWWRVGPQGRLDLLRPAAPQALIGRDVLGMASFPLVPFSGRIRNGRFGADDCLVTLPADPVSLPHALHGLGWRSAWSVDALDVDRVVLSHAHDGSVWPWPYVARQTIEIGPGRLVLALALTNLSDRPMPAGIGHHPYFPRTPRATITARVAGRWIGGPDVMPIAWQSPPEPPTDPSGGLTADRVALDTAFTGWDRTAWIAWPERRATLVMTAEPSLSVLIIYTPPGEAFFCVEPVSHTPDAVNMAPGPGVVGPSVLEPGGTIAGTMTLMAEIQP